MQYFQKGTEKKRHWFISVTGVAKASSLLRRSCSERERNFSRRLFNTSSIIREIRHLPVVEVQCSEGKEMYNKRCDAHTVLHLAGRDH